ncbi:MAG: glutamine-hydrolyzing carbamoyl-phosphate synthase small subunit [Spirochaetaceae bacterium]|nr:glutamine-hydrolyzing carbamoyl-phosphate synthase small subunit [Spirochaetaceae bacterium]
MSDAYLILADGTVFKGKSIGETGTTIGETVFTTGMTGYLETLTDPSYYGQIVTQTFPLIGNYGVIPEDFESKKSWARGYIVRELCDDPSNFRCGSTLNDFLKKQGIIGICGIDTRALTKKLRESGVMNGMIASGENAQNLNPDELLEKIREYMITDAVKSVQSSGVNGGEDSPYASSKESATPSTGATPPYPQTNHTDSGLLTQSRKVVLFDFGAKANIERELEKRGCSVTVVPYDTTAEQVIACAPDGVMLSNGPGDPAENVGVISEISKLCDWNKKCAASGEAAGKLIPIFGICLGHQMLALARGAKTSKLKYGHRGGNHPVKDLETGRVYITSQNHGYAVEAASLPSGAHESFVNGNDGTCEGIEYTDIPAFSVQFHPEACGGPHDTNFLFDKFFELMQKNS